MTGETLRFVKNGLSNVVNGVSAAMLTLVLPHFFVHDFTVPVFRLWVLLFQLAAFVGFLNFGVQIAIGRYVALSLARGEVAGAGEIVGAGVQLLGVLAVIALVGVAGIAFALPVMFPHIAAAQIGVARGAFLWIGAALALGLPASGFSGALIGLQRNEVPALVNAAGKFGLGIALIIIAGRTHSLLAVAEGFFVGSVTIHLMQIGAFRIVCRAWKITWWRGLGAVRRQLIGYCASLSVWSVAMLMVTGLDIMLVGMFEFRAVAAYGLAASVVNYFAATFNSLLNPLIQVFARFHARGEIARSLNMLELATFLCSLSLVIGGSWAIGLSAFGFSLWVGPQLGLKAMPFFMILLVANIIRNSGSPFALFLIGNGQQRQVMLPPLFEGVSNLIFSVIGGWYFGALGVAFGTLVGACVGLAGAYVYSMPRTMPVAFRRLRFAWRTFAVPMLLSAPICLSLWLMMPAGRAEQLIGMLSLATALVLGATWYRYRDFGFRIA
jgi:O-antigen/teichoic acid export membrane protein